MDPSTSVETHHEPHGHDAAHEHHELGFWRKYIFSTDHKVIGIQYAFTGLIFLLFGFSLMMLMRWQLAYPGQALPVIGKLLPHIFGAGSMPGGKMTPDFYNTLGAMHGTIMVFFGILPLAFAAFGNFVVPLQIGAPDMAFPQVNMASYLAVFVGGLFLPAFLLLLAFPPLEAGIIMQLMDRVAATSFFMPAGLVVNGAAMHISGGGSPLLWQHLFWFLAHPEVYVLILPGMGIVAEVIANTTRKPLWGYRLLVYSVIFIGFMSFVVWAHHMFMTGMGTTMSTFFQTTTMIIPVPSVVILTCFIMSLYGGAIRFTTPMLFATAFLPMVAIGGPPRLPRCVAASDILPPWWACGVAIAQLPFVWNFFASLRHPKTAENPWQSTTLEWAAPSPPPHGNFVTPPVVYRDPYEYSVPGKAKDFSPQFAAGEA